MFRRVAGRRVLPRMDLAAQRRRTISRCQRRTVSGVTSRCSSWWRAFGITASRVARSARSAQFSFGRRGCRPAAAGQRADGAGSRSLRSSISTHAGEPQPRVASRVVRRNMNRRHMTGDHHGQMAGRATLLARAMDEILGTHNVNGSQPPASASAVARRGHPAGGGNGIPGSMDQWRNPASNASRGVAEAAATVTSATRKKNERLVSRASRRIRAAQAAGC